MDDDTGIEEIRRMAWEILKWSEKRCSRAEVDVVMHGLAMTLGTLELVEIDEKHQDQQPLGPPDE